MFLGTKMFGGALTDGGEYAVLYALATFGLAPSTNAAELTLAA